MNDIKSRLQDIRRQKIALARKGAKNSPKYKALRAEYRKLAKIAGYTL